MGTIVQIEWIAVSERIPNNDRSVLLFSRGGIDIGSVNEPVGMPVEWYDERAGFLDDVTHWAELPKAPI